MAITFDDGDYGWWVGVQRCGATVALAASLSLSVASGAQAKKVYSWQQDDPTHKLDEFYWQNTVRPGALSFYQRLPYLPDPEEIPAGSLHGQPDEDFWNNPVAPVAGRFNKLYLPDPEEIPSGNLFGQPDEDFWQNPTPPVAASISPPKPWQWEQNEIVAQAVAFQPDEDYWTNPVTPVSCYPSPRVFLDDDTIFFFPDEDYWQNPAAKIKSYAFCPVFSDDDAIFFFPDEDDWANPVQPAPATLGRLYLPDPEEIPAGSLYGQFDEDFWTSGVAPITPHPTPTAFRDDDVVIFVPSQPIDEDFWANWVSPASWAPPYFSLAALFSCDDVLVPFIPPPTGVVENQIYLETRPNSELGSSFAIG